MAQTQLVGALPARNFWALAKRQMDSFNVPLVHWGLPLLTLGIVLRVWDFFSILHIFSLSGASLTAKWDWLCTFDFASMWKSTSFSFCSTVCSNLIGSVLNCIIKYSWYIYWSQKKKKNSDWLLQNVSNSSVVLF